jgi:hypothetical protein
MVGLRNRDQHRARDGRARYAGVGRGRRAVASLLVLVAAILSYTALRSPAAGKWLECYADLIFVFGLMLMVVLGFVLAWVGRRWRGLRITAPCGSRGMERL